MEQGTRHKTTRRTRTPALLEGTGEILQHIRGNEPSTTSNLAAMMGMARSTVLQRLNLLAERRLIGRETATGQNRGRPATVWTFNPSAGHILAAHIGLSGFRLAVTDLDGAVLAKSFSDVDLSTGPDGLLQDLVRNFDALMGSAGLDPAQLTGIGVGVPRDVELISYLHSLGLSGTHWDRHYFHQVLQAHYDAPVWLDTDVVLLALAERNSAWTGTEAFVCVKLGTIIDAAILINGVPLHGASQLAGELAHIKVGGSREWCACGSTGCLDAVASGAALVRQMQAFGLDVHHPSEIAQMANDRIPAAVQAVRTAGRQIGEALSAVVNLLNPAAITFWGYLADAESPLIAGVREGLYPNALPGSSEPLTLRRAALGHLAGVHGAANLAIEQLLQPEEFDQALAAASTQRWN